MQSFARGDLAGLDNESRQWLESLNADGRAREDAIARLHGLLLRAARFEVGRRRASLPSLDRAELDDLAVQSADDALMAVLGKLEEFHGRSRFTTWAYKFALLEAAVKVRRRPWQEREISVEPTLWMELSDQMHSLESKAEEGELLNVIMNAIRSELTSHQREVLVAVAVAGVPIDVLADRLATTRGALYKTIHDARRRLRLQVASAGYEVD